MAFRDRLPAPTRTAKVAGAVVLTVFGAASISAPIALSSQDIVRWAGDRAGLGAHGQWPLATFVAMDLLAAFAVGMVVVHSLRDETGGAWHLVVWGAATASAWANYLHGSTLLARGESADAWWFYPLMSVAGPFVLELALRSVRQWVRQADDRAEDKIAKFRLSRWVFAFGETRFAVRLSVTERIARPADAVDEARRRAGLMAEPPKWYLRAVTAGTSTPAAYEGVTFDDVVVALGALAAEVQKLRDTNTAEVAEPVAADTGELAATPTAIAAIAEPATAARPKTRAQLEAEVSVDRGKQFVRDYLKRHKKLPTNVEIAADCDRSESWARLHGIIAAVQAELAAAG